ncbi:MAG: dipeptidase [Acidobacteriaceae bacterium]
MLRNSAALLLLIAPACVAAMAQAQPTPQSPTPTAMHPGTHKKQMSRDYKAIHNSAIIVDTHADTTQRLLDENYDMANPTGYGGYLDFKTAREGNLGAEFFSIWVDDSNPALKGKFAHRTLELIDAVYEQAQKHPAQMRMCFSPEDIERNHAQTPHKLCALMGIEGGHSIENSLALLRDYYRLGVRYMTLTWSNSNDWADSSGDITNSNVKHHGGLTEFGKDVVREMNRLGMMVDISHVSDKTFYNAVTVSRAPVIASHSSARALTNAPRNMTDEMLKAVANGPRGGGVVMVNFYSAFVDENFRKAYEGMAKERAAATAELDQKLDAENADAKTRATEEHKLSTQWANKIPRPPLSSLIDHIDHVAKVAGIDHVGLGSDFDGIPSSPEGIDSAADLPKITQELVKRGYNEQQIHKILGGNLLRVFHQVELVAKQIQKEEPTAEAGATHSANEKDQPK